MIRNRLMTLDELRAVLDWAAEEGWNPGLDDAEAFHAADPKGFFVAEDEGTPVAAISVVNHSDEFAFLGLYLCRPSHRGQGIGLALWQHAMEHAGGRTIGLDGVPDQQDNYIKSGFAHVGATTRYSGQVEGASQDGIRAATADDIPGLIEAEAEASNWPKPRFLSAWFRNTPHRRTFVSERNGDALGMATVRACRSGAKIGPLIAESEQSALALMRHAATAFGNTLIVDVPSTSGALDKLCNAQGLTPGFHTARMYRGTARKPESEFFAVGTLELG